MTPLEAFTRISRVPGVDQYILVAPGGQIAAQAIKDPGNVARMVLTCGQNSSAVGRNQFKYLMFPRENQKNFFIFPVGKYYLGVVKSVNMNNITLADNITKFLKSLRKEK